jgi:hypothetical protein
MEKYKTPTIHCFYIQMTKSDVKEYKDMLRPDTQSKLGTNW